jgi:O-antigen/teichoic acid export membrane protein
MEFIKKIIFHELVSGSFYLFTGSLLANLFAFGLNWFLARNLSYGDYAIFASLLSLITLAAIPANSLNTIIVKFSTDYFVNNQMGGLKHLYSYFLKFILVICAFIIGASLLLSIPLNYYLKLNNPLYISVSGLAIAAFYLNTLNTGFLQGLLKFKLISFLNVFGGLVKLLFGAALVMLGYKAFGGLWSVFFMTFGMFLLAFMPLRKIIASHEDLGKIKIKNKNVIKYALPAFVTVLFLTSFTSTDVILVKHFFEPHAAGFYAGMSLIGKVIFYFTFPIPLVMFPLLVKRSSIGKKYMNLFYLALLLVIVPSILITIFYFMYPDLVINIFLGGRDYLYLSKFLGIFGLYLTLFSVVNVCVNFFLSLNYTKVYIPVAIAAILQIIFIYFFHANFYQIIGVSMGITSCLLVVLGFLIYINYIRKIKA